MSNFQKSHAALTGSLSCPEGFLKFLHKYNKTVLCATFMFSDTKFRVTFAQLCNYCVLQDESEWKNKFDSSFMSEVGLPRAETKTKLSQYQMQSPYTFFQEFPERNRQTINFCLATSRGLLLFLLHIPLQAQRLTTIFRALLPYRQS